MSEQTRTGFQESQIRGLLLVILAEHYPRAVVAGALRGELRDFGMVATDRVWETTIAYLLDCGFAQVTEVEIRSRPIKQWKITTKGLNLIDGNIDADPGIYLPSEN